MRQRKLTFAILVLLAFLAGCKSESPTAPPLNTGGGGVTPPTNATVNVTASNANPVVNSTSVISAAVTVAGGNAPNGTAVQFTTNFGIFTGTGSGSALKTTTNGVATETLTSTTPGTATVLATVNNVVGSVTVTFSPQTVVTPSNAPTITGVSPSTGLPAGGTQVTITGTNFKETVRVLFDIGDGSPKEAFVVPTALTATQIVVISPAVNLGTGQIKAADIIVLTQAGSPAEQRVVRSAGFTYQAAVLTPSIRALQPTSGPVGGGTRVTIIGDAFQAPAQVFFGAAEAQIISVNFSQIIVMSPRASDTTPTGSGVVTGPVDVKVVNVNSGKSVTMAAGFRYTPKMQITTVSALEGPFSGGTRLKIDGSGFDQPLAVVVAGVGAQVISVAGSEIIVITNGVTPTGCADVTGPIVVTNTNNGDSANGPTFIYRVPKPVITAISNPNTLPGSATITVLNALGFPRITIGGFGATVTGTVVNPNGTTTFTVLLPPSLQLQTVACPAGGNAPQPTAFDVVFTSATTACTDTSPKGITVNPPAAPALFLNPAAFQPFTATITPASAGPPPVPLSVAPSTTQTVNLVNTGTSVLTITGLTTAGACTRFTPLPVGALPLSLNQCESFPIVEQYSGQTVPATETCTITITSNAPTKTLLLVGTSR